MDVVVFEFLGGLSCVIIVYDVVGKIWEWRGVRVLFCEEVDGVIL